MKKPKTAFKEPLYYANIYYRTIYIIFRQTVLYLYKINYETTFYIFR